MERTLGDTIFREDKYDEKAQKAYISLLRGLFGCGTVQITASDMGIKLYSDFCFILTSLFFSIK